MGSTRSTKFLKKKDTVTTKQRSKRIWRLKNTTKKSISPNLCGKVVQLDEDALIGNIFVNKDFELVDKWETPNIELKFMARRKKKGNKNVFICFKSDGETGDYVIKIQRH